MKIWELKEAFSNLNDNLEVVIQTGGEDGYGYSPVKTIEVLKVVEDVGIDGPYRIDSEGKKSVLVLSEI